MAQFSIIFFVFCGPPGVALSGAIDDAYILFFARLRANFTARSRKKAIDYAGVLWWGL